MVRRAVVLNAAFTFSVSHWWSSSIRGLRSDECNHDATTPAPDELLGQKPFSNGVGSLQALTSLPLFLNSVEAKLPSSNRSTTTNPS